jgi:anti-sigma factor ChrR (cupin superfamily)
MTTLKEKDVVVLAEKIPYEAFLLPGFHGTFQAAVVNNDIGKAPVAALLKMAPGSHIEEHQHPHLGEIVMVLEGEFINRDEVLSAGSYLLHGEGVTHGPHRTETGCTVLFIQSKLAGPEDSVLLTK